MQPWPLPKLPSGYWMCGASRAATLVTSLALAFAFIIALSLGAGSSHAVEPEEQLKDPALEARAREISAGLRCLVCQNQSIDDSDAPLAKDLRLVVRQQLQKGASNQETVDYIVARYGEFVLLKPRFSIRTLLLWSMPLILLVFGVFIAMRAFRSGAPQHAVTPLSEEEQRELRALLADPPTKK